MNSHWLNTTLITIPSASVASASRFSRSRSATKLSAYAMSAATIAPAIIPAHGVTCAFTASAADVYAPMPKNAACPSETWPA